MEEMPRKGKSDVKECSTEYCIVPHALRRAVTGRDEGAVVEGRREGRRERERESRLLVDGGRDGKGSW